MLYNSTMYSNHAFIIVIVFFAAIFAVRLWKGPAKKGAQSYGFDFDGAGGDGSGFGGGHGDRGGGDGGGACH